MGRRPWRGGSHDEVIMNGRERILAVLEGRPADRLPFMPITMMFAADHAGVPYGRYVKDAQVLVEAQLAVAEAYDFDFVSCISDPAREVADCGGAVCYFDDQPPAIDETRARLADKTELARLRIPDPLGGGRMHDRVRAVELFRERAGGRLIEGWIEGPCAMAADLRGINTLMTDFFDDPAFVRDLFAFANEMELSFARAQVRAGVEIVGVGDAAASLVGPAIYEEFVRPYEKKLVDDLHALGVRVRLHICGNTRRILAGMGTLGCDIVDLDYFSPVGEAREKMGPGPALLGNIDPVRVLKNGTPEGIRKALDECRRGAGDRYVVGAGCEIPRGTPKENVLAMRDFARKP